MNLVFLDIVIFLPQKRLASIDEVKPDITTIRSEAGVCSSGCRDVISSEITKFTSTYSATAVSPLNSPQKNVMISAPSVPREYNIELGTGFTRSEIYEELNGASAFVDTNNYPKIKSVTFEVYLRNPTGNGITYAKLYNVTDKHDVWFSEVSFVGGGSARREATVNLEPGNKEYRVMLKSSLKYDVYVDNARIKISTN